MAKTYTPITTTTLTSVTNSVNLTSIPATYTDLILVVNVKAEPNNYPILLMRFNSDSGANYSRTYMIGEMGNATSGRNSAYNQMYPGPGSAAGITDYPNLYSYGIMHIMSYANTSVFKTVLSRDASPRNLIGANQETGLFVNLWRSTAAISTINITTNNGANYDVGSSFTLYGIKAA